MYEVLIGVAGGFGGPVGGGIAEAATAFIEQWIEELRARAIGGTIDTDAGQTTLKAFLNYSTADDAKQTGIVQLINAAGATADSDAAEFDARYQGRGVVVRIRGETEQIISESRETNILSSTPTGFGRA